jgi:phospholipase C
MDGFTAANAAVPEDPNGHRTMGYYTGRDLPFYYKLYRTFAMGDHYFASALTQTFPNRFYLYAGTSFGEIGNRIFDQNGLVTHSQRTIFNLLDEATPAVTWKIYVSQYLAGLPFTIEYLFGYVRMHPENVRPIAEFFTDARAGTLPQVAFLNPIFSDATNVETDEHPPSNVQVGQRWVSSVVGAFIAGPQWDHGALFITYDEHGGFYDHAKPPAACLPDDIPPMLATDDAPGMFDRYGIRVPAVVVSPYARKHFVSHVVHDHTSILRFIETRFDLPALTRRDANADPMLEFFKFKRPGFRKRPHFATPPVSPAGVEQCKSAPPNGGL